MSDFRWVQVKDRDAMETFYRCILPKIREAARANGYAIGVHGSLRRDLDLIAVPWIEQCSPRDRLAADIHQAACGIESSSYRWESKPHGRAACSFPICWPEWDIGDEKNVCHIDLSVTSSAERADDAKG